MILLSVLATVAGVEAGILASRGDWLAAGLALASSTIFVVVDEIVRANG